MDFEKKLFEDVVFNSWFVDGWMAFLTMIIGLVIYFVAGGICISVMSDIPNDSDAVNYVVVSYQDKGLMKATALV